MMETYRVFIDPEASMKKVKAMVEGYGLTVTADVDNSRAFFFKGTAADSDAVDAMEGVERIEKIEGGSEELAPDDGRGMYIHLRK